MCECVCVCVICVCVCVYVCVSVWCVCVCVCVCVCNVTATCKDAGCRRPEDLLCTGNNGATFRTCGSPQSRDTPRAGATDFADAANAESMSTRNTHSLRARRLVLQTYTADLRHCHVSAPGLSRLMGQTHSVGTQCHSAQVVSCTL